MKRPTNSKTNQASLSAGFFSSNEKELNQMGKEVVFENVDMGSGNATRKTNDVSVGTDNHTNTQSKSNLNDLPDHVRALSYLYQKSIDGKGATNNAYGRLPRGNHYFRNHFNKRGAYESLRVVKERSTYLGKTFLKYRLHPDEYTRVEETLSAYGLL